MYFLKKLRHISLGAYVLLFSGTITGQTNYGLGTSNYLVSASNALNPAESGRMKHNWYVSPFAFNVSIHNNYLALNMPYSPYRLLNNSVPSEYRNKDGRAFRNWDWVSTNENEDKLNFSSISKVQGPAIYMRHGNWVYGISNEVNIFAQVLGLPKNLVDDQLNQLRNEVSASLPDVNSFSKELEKKNDIQLLQNTYHAVNLSIARVFELKNDRNLSIGATYKLINSIGGLAFQMQSDGISIDTNSGNYHFNKPQIQLTEYYARNNKFKPHGLGGLDVGLVYTFRNKETQRNRSYLARHTNYKYKLGFSVLDIGNLVYTRTIQTKLDIQYGIDLSLLDKIQTTDPDQLFKELEASKVPDKESSILTTYGERVRMGLATRMVLSTDFQVYRRFYLSTVWVKSLRRQGVRHLYTPDLIQITPRIEWKYMELGLPIAVRKVRPNLTQGLTLRIFNFFVSTQNLTPFFRSRRASEVSIYMGVQFSNFPGPFLKKKYPYRKFSKKRCAEF